LTRHIGRWMEDNMKPKIALLLLPILGTLSCTHQPPETPIYKIYEFCRKDKTDAAFVARMHQLGLDISKEESKFFVPKTRTDYDYFKFTLNPQNDKTLQGFFITWKKTPGLTYEEIQHLVGITMPNRGSKELRSSETAGNTRFYVLNHQSLNHPDSQVTLTCAKNNYDVCWEIQLACFEFVHN